jgi:CubicO group peptidase (beta-lactamase class C family)
VATGTRARAVSDAVAGVMRRALADSAFPGAIAVVGTGDSILARVAVGHLDWGGSAAPDVDTMWDLASLTKVVALTSAVMRLVERGELDLDAPVHRYLPQWTGDGKERVRIRHLLTHSSGLPPWRPLYKEADDPAAALALVLFTPLDTVPGARMAYSDLGAILLGQVVERVSGEPFADHVARHFFAPLGMTSTRFLPPAALRGRIAPTEYDPWRQREVWGEVHDENAFALGGVSSHAGLFGSARDLARFARMYLGGGMLGEARVLAPATIARFTARADSSLSHRALGWETPSASNSAGRMMSPRAFGHTGFTGTSVWIDPERDLFIILLSNRVNPTRENRRIGQVRVALADTVGATLAREASGAPAPSRSPSPPPSLPSTP